MSDEKLTPKYSKIELMKFKQALVVAQKFAEYEGLPCLRDCCGDGLDAVKKMENQTVNEKTK